MKLLTLHARLTELVEAGYGDHHVIDGLGNDVRDVHAPQVRRLSRAEDSAVMLGTCVDDEGWDR